jgi:mono/diheme cytochrome c family protein
MFTGMLHTHKLVVILFLLLYLVKTLLLLLNKKEGLASFTKMTRIPEMVISTLFLLTGGYLLFQMPEINRIMVIKIICVFASIPLAVIGFRKSNKVLASLAMLLIMASYGLAEMSKQPVKKEIATVPGGDEGKAAYDTYCASCHGADGKLMLAGAKDLSTSTMDYNSMLLLVSHGKNAMPAFSSVLSEEQIEKTVKYVETLRQ